MTKDLKLFLIVFVSVFVCGWGANVLGQNLQNLFYWQEMTANPEILAAQTNQMEFIQMVRDAKPFRDNAVADLEVNAKAAFSLLLNARGGKKILFEKNADQSLPIASVSKLMTANVILKNYDLAKEIIITKEAVGQEESFGKLRVDDILTVKQLLYPLLMESSNDAAFALANDYDGVNEEVFVGMMNQEAQNLSLRKTLFVNSSGLDPEVQEPPEKINVSSARDLATLSQELLKTPLVWEILSTPKISLYNETLTSTNKLLGVVPGIIGGKTGYTDTALGCFVLVVEAPENKGQIVNVILGTTVTDRFSEMEKLINWTNQAYQW